MCKDIRNLSLGGYFCPNHRRSRRAQRQPTISEPGFTRLSDYQDYETLFVVQTL